MSNGIKFVFLLSVILIVMFSLTFAQDTPFNAEVIVEVARMRWGPGPAYTVQHYANLGHILTILEADTESDPPWTWYYARTPSGVQSWVRGDLVRRATGAAAVVDIPTGTYPVVENNLCNDPIYRRCQDGTDHDLWQSGYWAHDRYNHWETGGWNLNVVYHNNPCKSDRLCTTREQWDAGAIEAVPIAGSLTPEATWTPVVIRQTVEGPPVVWESQSLDATSVTVGGIAFDLYNPPVELLPTGDNRWPFGGFRISSESLAVYCHHWYRTDQNALVRRGRQSVNLNRLPEDAANDGTRAGENRDYSNVKCFSSIGEGDVVARYWELTWTRSYGNFGGISGITWRLTAMYGTDDPGDTCTRAAKCTDSLDTTIRGNLDEYTGPQPTAAPPVRAGFRVARPVLFAPTAPNDPSCTGLTRTQGEEPNRTTFHQYTCEDDDGDLQNELTVHFTHTENRYVAPTPTATP